jgi:hypothetical protein
MKIEYQEVNFEKYCKQCTHKDVTAIDPPCSECMDEPTNLYTDKPVKFEKKEK